MCVCDLTVFQLFCSFESIHCTWCLSPSPLSLPPPSSLSLPLSLCLSPSLPSSSSFSLSFSLFLSICDTQRSASVEECLAAVSDGALACHSSHTMWLSWMNFCLSVFSRLADKIECGDISRGDVRRKTRELLLKVLLLGHLNKKADHSQPETKMNENDVMSALFSVYVDLTVMEG